MPLDRMHAEIEGARDLLVAVAAGDALQDFELARGQHLASGARRWHARRTRGAGALRGKLHEQLFHRLAGRELRERLAQRPLQRFTKIVIELGKGAHGLRIRHVSHQFHVRILRDERSEGANARDRRHRPECPKRAVSKRAPLGDEPPRVAPRRRRKILT